jgi:hypothetical protein
VSPLDRLEDRYRNDAPFRQLVELLMSAIHNCHLTPSEVRDAAFFASLRYEERHGIRFVVVEATGELRYPTEDEKRRARRDPEVRSILNYPDPPATKERSHVMSNLDRFNLNQRVVVHLAGDGDEPTELPGTHIGTVKRIRSDGGAWVHLDARLEGELEKLHPFPSSDETRITSVLTYPEYCEAVK